jgi:hypothetical protein
MLNTTLNKYHTETHDITETASETASDLSFSVRQKSTLNRKINMRLAARKPKNFNDATYKTKSAKLPASIKKSASLAKNFRPLAAAGCLARLRAMIFFAMMSAARKMSMPITILGKNTCDVEYWTSNLKNESIRRPAFYSGPAANPVACATGPCFVRLKASKTLPR